MLTGFHGFHVIVGTVFLLVCWFRFVNMHFTRTDHFGLEAAIWYWHFVDVIWIFLFLVVYLWPSVYFFENWNDCFFRSGHFHINLNTKVLQNLQYINFILKNFETSSVYLFSKTLNQIEIHNKFFHYNFNADYHFLEYFYYSTRQSIEFIILALEESMLDDEFLVTLPELWSTYCWRMFCKFYNFTMPKPVSWLDMVFVEDKVNLRLLVKKFFYYHILIIPKPFGLSYLTEFSFDYYYPISFKRILLNLCCGFLPYELCELCRFVIHFNLPGYKLRNF
jgi:hypothetical protein